MISTEWYLNFVAVYRAGSVSGAARERHLTQPAVSQALAALESAVGVPLFERTSRGMRPTARGETLYAQVFDAVDRLERVGRSLSPKPLALPTFRLGTSPEYFHEFALPRLAPLATPFAVTLGEDRDLLAAVETGAVDAAVTVIRPNGRTLQHRDLGERRYVLIGPPSMTVNEAEELNDLPWVSYSEERPLTRRVFQQALGIRFEAKPRLVVPDLRAVVRAVELGVGASLVPEFACRRALDEGRLHELLPLEIPADRWHLTYRDLDSDRPDLQTIAEALKRNHLPTTVDDR